MYVLTEYQEVGGSDRASGHFPSKGFEIQVNNSHTDRVRTGSLYHVSDVLDDSPAKDDEWFTETITVKGDTITVKVNDKQVVDWTQPAVEAVHLEAADAVEQRTDGGRDDTDECEEENPPCVATSQTRARHAERGEREGGDQSEEAEDNEADDRENPVTSPSVLAGTLSLIGGSAAKGGSVSTLAMASGVPPEIGGAVWLTGY